MCTYMFSFDALYSYELLERTYIAMRIVRSIVLSITCCKGWWSLLPAVPICDYDQNGQIRGSGCGKTCALSWYYISSNSGHNIMQRTNDQGMLSCEAETNILIDIYWSRHPYQCVGPPMGYVGRGTYCVHYPRIFIHSNYVLPHCPTHPVTSRS